MKRIETSIVFPRQCALLLRRGESQEVVDGVRCTASHAVIMVYVQPPSRTIESS
jgi:hypothetical protein